VEGAGEAGKWTLLGSTCGSTGSAWNGEKRREMAGEWGLVRWFVGREVQDTYVYEIRVLLCDVINLINIFIRSKPRNERLF
jgi:hypothetical protein